ncbi:molecular chaperone [Aurantiacibacter xanthus]|uniref:Molecular chaperone n=1 Tax=Aurantiacibacter xanthus TaxID=1784712 RepID=A0A3A1P6Y8_9SPHN|nr:ATP12 family protein [Aurantiacibacter xanthus]RIV83247.1 molecular chaperone [Aurantiacibacter xanthus]
MKRFYKNAAAARIDGGWQVQLDGRGIRTQGGGQQVVPTEAVAQLLAGEWAAQGDKIDPKSFVFRDLADLALDTIANDRAATVAKLLAYAETDTLCYRAEPGEPLFERQDALWEPLVKACEQRHTARFERISGIIHRPQPETTMAALRTRLERESDFTLAALLTLASLSASLIVALAVLEEGEAERLFAAANAEEDWQAELWGSDWEAEKVRALRLEAFQRAAEFAAAVRT